jgi:hypothetical protein
MRILAGFDILVLLTLTIYFINKINERCDMNLIDDGNQGGQKYSILYYDRVIYL